MSIVIEGAYFEPENCIECGVRFYIAAERIRHARENGGFFHCPNGHSQGWTKDQSEIGKLRRERDRLVQNEARLEDEKREQIERAVKAEASERRLKRRIGAGTCPCCTLTFSNLAQHMSDQHPEMAPRQLSKRRTISKRLMLSAPR